MKNFNIPGPYTQYPLNMFFLQLKLDHPEAFYPDIKISSVFGNFQYCIWDGGRNFGHYVQNTEEDILEVKKSYEHFKVPIRFVFTNPVVEKKHLSDRFCNLCLEIFNTGKNEVVVNSPLLEDYIKENYPSYKIISSTTKRILNTENFIKELENPNYYQVCLDYDLNKNMDLINSIPKELRSKCEFLINAICPAHCPQRKEHYALTGQAHITYLRDKYINEKCGIGEISSIHPIKLGKGNNFNLEEIDQYHKLGYKYFKIEGRTLPSFDVLSMYIYYMIKPEWHFEVMRKAFFNNDFNILFNCPNSDLHFDMTRLSYSGVAL